MSDLRRLPDPQQRLDDNEYVCSCGALVRGERRHWWCRTPRSDEEERIRLQNLGWNYGGNIR